MPRRPGHEPDEMGALVRRGVDMLRRRRWQLLALFVLLFLVVQVVGFLWPATYVGRAAVLLEVNRSKVPVDADPTDPTTVLSGAVSEEEVMSEIAVMTSHEVLAKTVEAAGLDRAPLPWYLKLIFGPVRAYDRWYADYHDLPVPTPMDRAIQGLTNNIKVERLKDSNVLVVSFESGNPEVAEIVLGELLANYLRHHLQVHQPYVTGPFFDQQADLFATDLRRQEDEFQQIKQEAGVADITAEREVQLEHDAQLRVEAATLARQRAELAGRVRVLESELTAGLEGGRSAPLMRSATLDKLKAEVRELEQEQVRLTTRYTDDFPLVVENLQKLALSRQALVEERGNAAEMSPTLLEVERELANTRAQLAGIVGREAVVAQQQTRSRRLLMALDRQTLEATRAERLIAAAEKRYMLYLERGEEARIKDMLNVDQVTNVTLVQKATASTKPVRPKKTIVLLVSVVGAALAAFLIVLLLELRSLGLASVLAAMAPDADDEGLDNDGFEEGALS